MLNIVEPCVEPFNAIHGMYVTFDWAKETMFRQMSLLIIGFFELTWHL